MNLIEEYVKKNLLPELRIVQASTAHASINLTDYEKALVYKYSDEGFRQTNKALLASGGNDFDNFGILLYNTISKLPDFRGIVYRKVYLTSPELDRYIQAFQNQVPILEHPFISTSRFVSVATGWLGTTNFPPNCLFVIYTKSGKAIELISKFTDEKEVLLKPNTKFSVLNVFEEPDFFQITMEEL